MELLTIGEVSRRSGVAASALRYYEERGLIESLRQGRGKRLYPRQVLRKVAFIVFAQKVGLTLEEIHRELSKLAPGAVPNPAEWAKLSGQWRRRIDARIAELQVLRDSLTGCIGCGCLSFDACQLVNPGDRLAGQGPGPRLWVGASRSEET